jgi:hypothetical protein
MLVNYQLNKISGSFSKSSWVSRVTFQDFGQVVELRDRFFNDQQRGKSNFSGISSNDLLCVENYSFHPRVAH